jgi:hypothetical protein
MCGDPPRPVSHPTSPFGSCHCEERQRRSNPESSAQAALDCFADARNDDWTSSCPAKRGRGTTPRSRVVEGASASKLALPPPAPPPCFAWSPSPAPFHCAGADKQNHSRDALTRPSLAHDHNAKIDSIPAIKEGSGAPKGACHPCPRCANKCAQCAPLIRYAAARPFRGAPAFRRSRLRHSPPAITPMAQPQNRVSRRRTAQVFCPLGPSVDG